MGEATKAYLDQLWLEAVSLLDEDVRGCDLIVHVAKGVDGLHNSEQLSRRCLHLCLSQVTIAEILDRLCQGGLLHPLCHEVEELLLREVLNILDHIL